MDMPDPDGELRPFRLTESKRQLRLGDTRGAPVDIIVALSNPLVLPLSEGLVGDDKELGAFWAAERGRYRYDYVTFRVGFSPNTQSIEKAWVEVILEPLEDGGPQAWSMAPALMSDDQKVTQKANLKGQFKLVGAEVEHATEQQFKRWFLRSRMVRPTQPNWEFAATPASPIDGEFKLQMVVRSIARQAGRGRVTARATIAGRSFMIFALTSKSEQDVGVTFTLDPDRPAHNRGAV